MLKKYILLLAVLSLPFVPVMVPAGTTLQHNEVILFYKPRCRYCPYMEALFNQLHKQNQGKAIFKKININGNNTYKSKYGFLTVPTVVYIKNGNVVAKHGSNNKTYTLTAMQRHMQSF